MKKLLLILVIICGFAQVMDAQIKNIEVGGIYSTNTKIFIDNHINNDVNRIANILYKPTYGGEVILDLGTRYFVFPSSLEVSYITGQMSNYECLDNEALGWKEGDLNSIKSFSIMYYAGVDLIEDIMGKPTRVKFPLKLGVGYTNTDAGPASCNLMAFGARAQLKLYISDHFGIYAGAGYKGRITGGLKTKQEGLNVGQNGLFFDAGIVIGLN